MASQKLNFDSDRLITGINIIDGMLFFTDGETEPKKINIDHFKAASHDTGTTVIYGREFLERDITVIKEHPVEAINVNLSDTPGVNVDGENPLIITEKSIINSLIGELYGFGFENGTAFIERGFYYLEASTKPSKSTLFSTGTKVESILNGNQFTGFTETLTLNKKYYYAAYGKTAIGERVEGDILPFFVDASSPSGLEVETLFPSLKQPDIITNFTGFTNEFYNVEQIVLNGRVNNNGGSNIVDVGFAYRVVYENQSANVPTDLLDDSNNLIESNISNFKKAATNYDADTGTFSTFINKPVSSIIYIQAYAINNTGFDDGSVVRYPLESSTGLQRPDVKTNPESTSVRTVNSAEITGRVHNPYGNIEKTGFLFSKNTSDKNQLIKAITTAQPGVFNREVNPPLYSKIFNFKTTEESGLTLSEGETLHFLAYAKNHAGLFGYGNVVDLDFLKKEEDKVYVKTIVDPNNAFETSSNQDSIKLGLNLVDHAGTVEKLGWFIAKSEIGTDLFPGKSATDPLNKSELQNLVNKGDAVFFTAQSTDKGEQFKNFTGKSPISVERGHDYYIAATATNSLGTTGIGDIVKVPFKKIIEGGGFDFRTNSVTSPGSTTATFNGEIIERKLGADSIQEAGFVWANALSALPSLRQSGSQHILVSSVADINTYLTTGTGAGKYFSVAATGLPSDSTIHVQAFIKTSSSGERIYANEDNVFTNESGEGIVKFRTQPTSPTIEAGSMSAISKDHTSTGAIITARLFNDGGSGLDLIDMSPKFYYMKKATVEANAASTEEARKLYMYGNASSPADADSGEINADITASEHYEPNDDRNVAQIMFGKSNHLATPPPKLDSNTEYFYFATADNGVSGHTPDFGSGRFDSQGLRWFKTEDGSASKPFPSDVTVSGVDDSIANFKSTISSHGGDNVFTSSGFYYVRSSLYTGNSVSGLVASGSKITVNTTPTILNKKINNLSFDTEYKVVAFLGNAQGVGYSKNITTFRTAQAPTTYSIFVSSQYSDGETFKEFNALGGAEDGNPYVYVEISPNDSNYTFTVTPWDNGDSILVDAQKVLTNSGQKALKLRVPTNTNSTSRSCSLTVRHLIDKSKTSTLDIYQSNGSTHNNYGYFDY